MPPQVTVDMAKEFRAATTLTPNNAESLAEFERWVNRFANGERVTETGYKLALRGPLPILGELNPRTGDIDKFDMLDATQSRYQVVWACWPNAKHEASVAADYAARILRALKLVEATLDTERREVLGVLVPVAFMPDRDRQGSYPWRDAFLTAVAAFASSARRHVLVHALLENDNGDERREISQLIPAIRASNPYVHAAPHKSDFLANVRALRAHSQRETVFMVTGDPGGHVGNGGLSRGARFAFDERLARLSPLFPFLFNFVTNHAAFMAVRQLLTP